MTTSITGATGLNSNLYNLYVQDTIKLARTVVIKLDQIAEAMNNLVMLKAGTTQLDLSDRTTWKYYQNISGVYNFTDTPMLVESLDGNSLISFDKTTLQSNPITRDAYVYGSYYYNELVANYPDQEMLILGILYPCDITTAIAAKDGTILSYPTGLVEDSETDFIAKLQTWIYGFLGRWVVQPFALSDNLYVATYFGQLILQLVPTIMNIRLAACKTNQAHSFHIGQYLRSHGFLDFYLAELTREQTLDFYRNINYYLRRAGFADNFETLVNLLMTKRGLPLYEYNFKHNVGAINYVDVADASNILPKAAFKREPLNDPARGVPLTDFNLTDVFALTAYETPGNHDYQLAHKDDIELTLDRSKNSELATKVLESTLPPSAQAQVQASEATIFNHWLALAADGTYTASFQFTAPGTTIPIQLNQQQAVALWIYAMNKALEPEHPSSLYVPITRVPRVCGVQVAAKVQPTFSYLRGKTDALLVSDALITQAISIAATVPDNIPSIEDFSTFCTSVFEAGQLQNLLYSFQENPDSRGQMQFVTESFYHRVVHSLTTLTISDSPYVGVEYTTFLSDIGFTPSNYSALDYYNLTTALYQAATGANLDSVNNPVNIQAAMIALLKLLSSYSILVVSSTNTNEVVNVGRPDVRVRSSALEDTIFAYVSGAEVQASWAPMTEIDTVMLDWDVLYPLKPLYLRPTFEVTEDLDAYNTDSFYLEPSTAGLIPIGVSIGTDFDPYASFNALTLEQQRAVVALRF
jgi:hypothetical protein